MALRSLSLIKFPGGGGIDNANNGASISSGFVQWGGNPLIHDTTIDFSSFNFNALNTSGSQSAFNIHSEIDLALISTNVSNSSHIFWYPENYNISLNQGRFSQSLFDIPGVNLPDTRDNVVFNFACYNAQAGGGPEITGEASYRFAGESYFDIGGVGQSFEFHLPEISLNNGTIFRPNSWYISRVNGSVNWDAQISNITIAKPVNGVTGIAYDYNSLKILYAGSGGSIQFNADTGEQLIFSSNHAISNLQISSGYSTTQMTGQFNFDNPIKTSSHNANATVEVTSGLNLYSSNNSVTLFLAAQGDTSGSCVLSANGSVGATQYLELGIVQGGNSAAVFLDTRSGVPPVRMSGNGVISFGLFSSGRIGIGNSVVSGSDSNAAWLQIEAGTTSVAPLQLFPGTILTTPVSGVIESDGTHLYWTDNTGTRHTIV